MREREAVRERQRERQRDGRKEGERDREEKPQSIRNDTYLLKNVNSFSHF